jgi:hypothetical protein
VHEVREMQREQIVDRRGPYPVALGRIHPVGEVEDVELAYERLDGWVPKPAPSSAPEMGRRWHNDKPALDGHAVQRALDPPRAARTDRRERYELVLLAGLGEAAQHREDVIPDSREGHGKRRDIDNDPHALNCARS